MLLEPGHQFCLPNHGIAVELIRVEGRSLYCRIGTQSQAANGSMAEFENTIASRIDVEELQRLIDDKQAYFDGPQLERGDDDAVMDPVMKYPQLECLHVALRNPNLTAKGAEGFIRKVNERGAAEQVRPGAYARRMLSELDK